MSKYRHWWYPNVERAIKQYPSLALKKAELQKSSLVPNYADACHSSLPSRTTEVLASRQLPDAEEQILRAVELAVLEIRNQKDGAEVLKIVDAVDWRQTHNIEGIAMNLNMGIRTAQSRHIRFVYTVGKYLGY